MLEFRFLTVTVILASSIASPSLSLTKPKKIGPLSWGLSSSLPKLPPPAQAFAAANASARKRAKIRNARRISCSRPLPSRYRMNQSLRRKRRNNIAADGTTHEDSEATRAPNRAGTRSDNPAIAAAPRKDTASQPYQYIPGPERGGGFVTVSQYHVRARGK